MSPLAAAILGLVQALTEFLPVSSSGHLVLGEAIMEVHAGGGAAFEVAVHVGTLLSVLLLFRRDVAALFRTLFHWLGHLGETRARWAADAEFRLGVAILIGCVPAGVVGVLFKGPLEQAFSAPRLVGVALICTGVLLLVTLFAPRGDQPVTPGRALLIGVAQAIAIIPGVSRSGSTIATALFLRVEREKAARFSFLMSLPVIAGAAALTAKDLLRTPPPGELATALAVGACVSFVGGVAALWLLLAVVRRGWFPHFGWYCLVVGAWALLTF